MAVPAVYKLPTMIRLAVLALALSALAQPALADCADPPAPGVDWRRCVMHARDLYGLNLSGALLRDGRFTRAILDDTDLSGSDGRSAKFNAASARGANFDGARLNRADFTGADLRGASLRGADLFSVQLVGADLRRADLTGADLERTSLQHANLAGATWVDGETTCSDDSIGLCRRARRRPPEREEEPGG